jgi:hypothetical protein
VGGFTHRSGKVVAGKRFMQAAVDANKDTIDTYALSKLHERIREYVTQ